MRLALAHMGLSIGRYSRVKEVIGQPPSFHPIKLSLTLVALMLVNSSCSLENCGSTMDKKMGERKREVSEKSAYCFDSIQY